MASGEGDAPVAAPAPTTGFVHATLGLIRQLSQACQTASAVDTTVLLLRFFGEHAEHWQAALSLADLAAAGSPVDVEAVVATVRAALDLLFLVTAKRADVPMMLTLPCHDGITSPLSRLVALMAAPLRSDLSWCPAGPRLAFHDAAVRVMNNLLQQWPSLTPVAAVAVLDDPSREVLGLQPTDTALHAVAALAATHDTSFTSTGRVNARVLLLQLGAADPASRSLAAAACTVRAEVVPELMSLQLACAAAAIDGSYLPVFASGGTVDLCVSAVVSGHLDLIAAMTSKQPMTPASHRVMPAARFLAASFGTPAGGPVPLTLLRPLMTLIRDVYEPRLTLNCLQVLRALVGTATTATTAAIVDFEGPKAGLIRLCRLVAAPNTPHGLAKTAGTIVDTLAESSVALPLRTHIRQEFHRMRRSRYGVLHLLRLMVLGWLWWTGAAHDSTTAFIVQLVFLTACLQALLSWGYDALMFETQVAELFRSDRVIDEDDDVDREAARVRMEALSAHCAESSLKSVPTMSFGFIWFALTGSQFFVSRVVASRKIGMSASVDGSDADDDGDVCAVCMRGFSKGQVVSTLSCGHSYHSVCIQKWFRTELTCPLDKLPSSPSPLATLVLSKWLHRLQSFLPPEVLMAMYSVENWFKSLLDRPKVAFKCLPAWLALADTILVFFPREAIRIILLDGMHLYKLAMVWVVLSGTSWWWLLYMEIASVRRSALYALGELGSMYNLSAVLGRVFDAYKYSDLQLVAKSRLDDLNAANAKLAELHRNPDLNPATVRGYLLASIDALDANSRYHHAYQEVIFGLPVCQDRVFVAKLRMKTRRQWLESMEAPGGDPDTVLRENVLMPWLACLLDDWVAHNQYATLQDSPKAPVSCVLLEQEFGYLVSLLVGVATTPAARDAVLGVVLGSAPTVGSAPSHRLTVFTSSRRATCAAMLRLMAHLLADADVARVAIVDNLAGEPLFNTAVRLAPTVNVATDVLEVLCRVKTSVPPAKPLRACCHRSAPWWHRAAATCVSAVSDAGQGPLQDGGDDDDNDEAVVLASFSPAAGLARRRKCAEVLTELVRGVPPVKAAVVEAGFVEFLGEQTEAAFVALRDVL